MSLSCFFGVEVRPDGLPFTPVIPPKSSLVITQCAIISAAPTDSDVSNRDEIAAANAKAKSPAGAAAAAAAAGSPSSPAAALLPSTYSAVTLYVQSSEVPSRIAVCTLSPGQQLYFSPLQLIFGKHVTFTLVPQHKPLRAGAPVAYPTVHITGYYEREDAELGGDNDDDDDGNGGIGMDEEDEEDQDGRRHAFLGRGRGRGRGGDESGANDDYEGFSDIDDDEDEEDVAPRRQQRGGKKQRAKRENAASGADLHDGGGRGGGRGRGRSGGGRGGARGGGAGKRPRRG